MQFHLYHALHKESYYPLNASCIHFFLFKYVHARSDTCCCITLGVLWQDKVFLRGPAVRGNTVKPTGSIVLEIITGSFLIATMCCRARRKVLVLIHLHPFLRHFIPYTKTDYPPFSIFQRGCGKPSKHIRPQETEWWRRWRRRCSQIELPGCCSKP